MRTKKRPPESVGVPGGQRTSRLFRERLDGSSRVLAAVWRKYLNRDLLVKLYFEAIRLPCRTSLRGPQSSVAARGGGTLHMQTLPRGSKSIHGIEAFVPVQDPVSKSKQNMVRKLVFFALHDA